MYAFLNALSIHHSYSVKMRKKGKTGHFKVLPSTLAYQGQTLYQLKVEVVTDLLQESF